MAIILNPEQERIVEAQIVSGRFHSVDEVLDQAFSVLQDSSAKGASLNPSGRPLRLPRNQFATMGKSRRFGS